MAILSPHRLLKTPAPSPPLKYPVAVSSLAEYKSSIRKCSDPATVSDHLTSDVTCLAARVLKESQNNKRLLSFYSQVANAPGSIYPSTSRQKKTPISNRGNKENRDRGRAKAKAKQKPKKRRRRAPSESSSSTSSKSSFNSEEGSSASSSS